MGLFITFWNQFLKDKNLYFFNITCSWTIPDSKEGNIHSTPDTHLYIVHINWKPGMRKCGLGNQNHTNAPSIKNTGLVRIGMFNSILFRTAINNPTVHSMQTARFNRTSLFSGDVSWWSPWNRFSFYIPYFQKFLPPSPAVRLQFVFINSWVLS